MSCDAEDVTFLFRKFWLLNRAFRFLSRTFKFLSRTFCLWVASQLALESRRGFGCWIGHFGFYNGHFGFLNRSCMLVAEADYLDCWSGRRSLFLSCISFICVIRWAFWLLGSSACPVASRLLRWLLGFRKEHCMFGGTLYISRGYCFSYCIALKENCSLWMKGILWNEDITAKGTLYLLHEILRMCSD